MITCDLHQRKFRIKRKIHYFTPLRERAPVFSDFTVIRLLSFSITELLPFTIAGTALGAGG